MAKRTKFLEAVTTSEDEKTVRTCEGIAMYAFVFRPYTGKSRNSEKKQDPKYSIQLVIPKANDIRAIRRALRLAGEEKFGTNFKLNSNKFKVALHDGDTMAADNPVYEDCWVIQAKSKDKPGIVDRFREPIDDETEFYSGCICRISVRAYAYDTESKGVGFLLNNIQKLADGERLSGRASAEEDFEDSDAGNDED